MSHLEPRAVHMQSVALIETKRIKKMSNKMDLYASGECTIDFRTSKSITFEQICSGRTDWCATKLAFRLSVYETWLKNFYTMKIFEA